MHQGCGEGVAGAHGVGDLHLEAGMFTAFAGRYEDAAAIAAGYANQFQVMQRQQMSRRVFLVVVIQFEEPHELWQLFMVEFDNGCEPHRFGEDWRSIKALPEIDVENPYCARP